MRILHTSDWHLGRSFHRVGLLEAQAAFVDHLVEVVRSERVSAVVVAGDVYDRALPGVDVVALLDDALHRLVGAGADVILTSGNHDSPGRLAFGARLLERAGVHVRTALTDVARPVLLGSRDGVALYPLPYLEPVVAAPVLGCTASHEAVLAMAMEAVRADLAARPAGIRSVVAAHAFVVGAVASDSERDISVGGVSAVPASVFEGVDYVALGHLHRRQQVAAAVRYSGSPLAYSFSEHGQVKGSLLLTLDRHGGQLVETVDAPVPRPLAVLRGGVEDLLSRSDLAAHERSWCQVTLTDAERPAGAMERLRARFPHTLELRFEPSGQDSRQDRRADSYTRRQAGRDDVELCCDFLDHVRARSATALERTWLQDAVTATRLAQVELSGIAPLRSGSRRTSSPDVAADPMPPTRPERLGEAG